MRESKENFLKRVNKLISEHNTFKTGLEFSFKVSQLYDEKIQELTTNPPDGLAIAAIGGLGRMEVSPFSDVDIVFIVNHLDGKENYISRVIQNLWDSGIKVSHLVRTFNQIFELAKEDIISFTQLLELRFVSGSLSIYRKFLDNVLNIINSEFKTKLLENLLADIEKRHSIYGDSPLLLEPNIKNTRGGLRDLHFAAWIYYLLNDKLPQHERFNTAFELLVSNLVNDNIINKSKANKLIESYDYLIKLRNTIHIINSNNKDRFDFQSQISVIQNLYSFPDYIDKKHQELMKKYFISALHISSLLEYFKKKAVNKIHPCELYKTYVLDEDFILCGKFIRSTQKERLSLHQILNAYYYKLKFFADFDSELENLIEKSLEYFDGTEINEIESKLAFRRILRYPDDINDVLIHMNRIGILGFLIPEFENLKLFFQPQAYHIYTTDEHTLIAIKNLYNLQFIDSILGEIFRCYEDKELLILAVLFHDIAKPITISGHEFIGAEIAENVMQRYGYDEDEIKLVSFLVKNHLLMEQTAFRRNLNDAETLGTFRNKFKSLKELDFLYLLTYADLSAVNPSLWTAWKSSLLNELYIKTREMILNNLTAEEFLSLSKEKLELKKYEIDEKEFDYHLEQINSLNYLFTFSESEIAEHIQEIKKGEELSILSSNKEDFTHLTVITRDSKGLLSKICGAISISDCNIHDATIFTRKDGIIIDSFKITDFITGKVCTEDKVELLDENITRVLFGMIDLESEFEEHIEKWKRMNKKFLAPIDIEINFENHTVYTIIDIHASDRIGLLYHITKTLTSLGLNIYFAKIGTKLNGVFDSFYVLDDKLQKINPESYERLKEQIIENLTLLKSKF